MLAIGLVGLAVTIGAIFGIVKLAREIGRSRSGGAKVLMGMAIFGLCGFVLVGLFATGCAAIVGGH